MIHIYCGDGKGKTTAAIGLAVRAAGSGRQVVLLQFFKDGNSAEFHALGQLEHIQVIPQARSFGFIWTLSPRKRRKPGTITPAFCTGPWPCPPKPACWSWTRP